MKLRGFETTKEGDIITIQFTGSELSDLWHCLLNYADKDLHEGCGCMEERQVLACNIGLIIYSLDEPIGLENQSSFIKEHKDLVDRVKKIQNKSE